MTGLGKPELCLVHRYLYYVLNTSLISDHEYDRLEKEAMAEVGPLHPLNQPGSSLPNSYPAWVAEVAEGMLQEAGGE